MDALVLRQIAVSLETFTADVALERCLAGEMTTNTLDGRRSEQFLHFLALATLPVFVLRAGQRLLTVDVEFWFVVTNTRRGKRFRLVSNDLRLLVMFL